MLLAISVVHHHLIRMGLRQRTSIVAEACDARAVHHLAALFGFGASAINPYLAIASVYQLVEDGEIDKKKALMSYTQAAEAGILKIMSKMGISVLSSYRGGCNFETVGLSRTVVSDYFPGVLSKISGIGLTGIEKKLRNIHREAFKTTDVILPIALAFIMFALGLVLTGSDFLRVIKQPRDFYVGTISQIILLPIIAFILVKLWPISPELAIGVMIIADLSLIHI